MERCRYGRLKAAGFAGAGMCELKHLCMQAHASYGIKSRTVFFIANNRVIDVLHVHPDLVLFPRLQIELQEGKHTAIF